MASQRLRVYALSALVLLTAAGCQQVGSGEQGVMFARFSGGTQDDVYKEGVHIVPPWNHLILYSVRTQDREERMTLLTSNGLTVGMDMSVRFKLLPSELPKLHIELGPDYYNVILKPTLRNQARQVVGKYTPEEIYSTKRNQVEAEIATAVRAGLEGRHLDLEGVLLRNIVLPERLQQAISEKLEEEQRSERMKFTLDREKQEAERKRIEAKGIADFQRIVSKGINDQLLQWKGIEATEKLASSPNAKVVVIGSSETGLPLILGN